MDGLLAREDPRTVRLATVGILAVGGIVAVSLLDRGGVLVVFRRGLARVPSGQVIWAAIRLRRRRHRSG